MPPHPDDMDPNIFQRFSKVKAITGTLVIFFSIGSWLGIKATFLEEPLLVGVVPEGWRLPSYLVVITQMGNLGPIVYAILQKLNAVRDSFMIYALLTIGTIAALMFSLFHEVTAFIFGAERSIAIFLSMFGFALVGCSSSVLFMPYMGRFREIYLVTYLFGEDVSGLLTSLVVMVQGVGGDPECVPSNKTDGEFEKYFPPPNFGISAFFWFVTILMVCSAIAFALLDRLKICRTQYSEVVIQEGNDYTYNNGIVDDEENETTKMTSATTEPQVTLSKHDYKYLLIMQAVVCLIGNGILPSIQSFSSLPYGNSAYHLVITLSTIASPAACFFAFFVPHHSVRQITVLMVVSGFLGSYATMTALLSPIPPLLGTKLGIFLIVRALIYLSRKN
jgi:riboflavin transporter 2